MKKKKLTLADLKKVKGGMSKKPNCEEDSTSENNSTGKKTVSKEKVV